MDIQFLNKIIFVITFLLMTMTQMLFCQVDPKIDARLEKRSHTFENTTLPYRLYVPDDYSPDRLYPVLLFLHGARWAGTDNITQLDNVLAQYWIDSTFQSIEPCFVVYPQIPSGTVWEPASGQVSDFPAAPELATANDIITQLFNEFSLDQNRIYACGKSIGGLGVYGLVARYPERYIAAIPAAGWYVYRSITELSSCAWWIFHNKDDTTVPVAQSRHVVTELENLGEHFVMTHCNFKTGQCDTMPDTEIDAAIQNGVRFFYSEFNDSGHQLEPNVVATHGLYTWVMQQSKLNSFVRSKIIDTDFMRISNYPNPFNDSTTISFTLLKSEYVTLTIKNIMGQSVTILERARLEKGEHSYVWHAKNTARGIYLYELKSGGAHFVGRCLLLN